MRKFRMSQALNKVPIYKVSRIGGTTRRVSYQYRHASAYGSCSLLIETTSGDSAFASRAEIPRIGIESMPMARKENFERCLSFLNF